MGEQAVNGVVDLDARLAVLLEQLRVQAAELVGLPLATLPGAKAAAVRRTLRVVGDQVHLAASMLLAPMEADREQARSGQRTIAGHVARTEGIGFGEASKQARLGQALGHLPLVREAAARGDITRGHADLLADLASSPARLAALTSDLPDRNEEYFLQRATELPVDEFRRLTRRAAVALDEQAAERERTAAVARQRFTMTPGRDGCT